jgi:hypothetical protein
MTMFGEPLKNIISKCQLKLSDAQIPVGEPCRQIML